MNQCSEDEFKVDFERASATKRSLEEAYGMNCAPIVNYGRWGRSADTPRLTRDEQRLLRKVFEFRDEIFVGTRIRRTYSSAVAAIQATPLGQRPAIFHDIESCLEEDADFEMFPDHEGAWDIKMLKD